MTLNLRASLPVALVLAASGLAWVLAPEPAPSRSGPAANEESWELPRIQRREPAKWTAALMRHSLWGEESAEAAAASAKAAATFEWNIVGVMIEGNDVIALIRVGDKPSEKYRVGDAAPDGSKITRIEEDRLYLSNNGGSPSVLDIYRK